MVNFSNDFVHFIRFFEFSIHFDAQSTEYFPENSLPKKDEGVIRIAHENWPEKILYKNFYSTIYSLIVRFIKNALQRMTARCVSNSE